MEKVSEQNGEPNKPSADDFDAYLPWACKQLQLESNIIIYKVYQNEYVSAATTDRSKAKPKSKAKNEPSKSMTDLEKEESASPVRQHVSDTQIVRIYTVYDTIDNLVELKFDMNRQVPKQLLKIISLIIPFQAYLNKITVNKGLDNGGIHELAKMVTVSNITDICLDNTVIPDANYDLLLLKQNNLRQLSLSRCRIDDSIVKSIAAQLIYPMTSSKTLLILNLASNRITDAGAKDLADALRSNRQIVYLNLAGNMLTDVGAASILEVLTEFPISSEEVLSSRARHMTFLKDKNDLVIRMIEELRIGEFLGDRKSMKRKSVRPPTVTHSGKKGKGLDKDASLKSVAEINKSLTNLDGAFFEKGRAMAENIMGDFKDPFSLKNINSKDGIVYCFGNNSLAYLNLSFNSLSYFTVTKLLEVFSNQKTLDRRPRGLINVCIEGNCLPINCRELTQIDDFLEMGLMNQYRKMSLNKKRPMSKSGR